MLKVSTIIILILSVVGIITANTNQINNYETFRHRSDYKSEYHGGVNSDSNSRSLADNLVWFQNRPKRTESDSNGHYAFPLTLGEMRAYPESEQRHNDTLQVIIDGTNTAQKYYSDSVVNQESDENITIYIMEPINWYWAGAILVMGFVVMPVIIFSLFMKFK